MKLEEIYKGLYTKYAPNLSQEELDKKLEYASTLDPSDFINGFYQKYTGQGPSQKQIDYMNSMLQQPEVTASNTELPKNKTNEALDVNGKPIEFKKDEDGRRMYFSKPDVGGESRYLREVGYEYDRSKGVRLEVDSWGKYIDNIAYSVIGKTIQSFQSGTPGELSEEAINIMMMDEEKRGKMTTEQAVPIINAMKLADQAPKSEAMQKWIKTVDEAKNPVYGFVKAMGEHGAEVSYEAMISSMAGQAKAFWESPEIRTAAITAGVAQSKFGGLNPYLRAAGFMRGMMSVLGGSVESASTFSELIKEQFGGEIPSEEEFIEFAKNEDLFNKFRNKALKKGLTIAAVDNFGGGMVVKSVAKTAKKGKKAAAVTKGVIGEAAVGATGEIAGSVIAGEEIQASAVGLEIIGQGPQAAIDIGSAVITPGTYRINGDKVTLKQLNKVLETAKPEELADMKIQIEGNQELEAEVNNKKNDAYLYTQIDEKVDDADRLELVNLEKQRAKAEANAKKKGIFTVPNAKGKLENIEGKIAEIVGRYEAVDGRTSDVRARKKVAGEVRQARMKILMEKIKSGVEGSKLYKEMDISTEQIADPEKAYEMYLENEESNALFDIGLLQEELANVKTEGERKLIQAEIKAIEDGVKDVRENKSEVMNSHGFLLEDSNTGKMKIVINEKKALADGSGNINVAAHEFLHAVLNKTFNTKENTFAVKTPRGLGASVGGSLFQYLKGLDPNIATNSFMGRLLNYSQRGEETQGQEVLNLMSDALIDGTFKPNEKTLNTIGDYFISMFESLGTRKLKWKNAKDVARFIKNFNKSIQGDKRAARIVKKAEQGIDIVTRPDTQVEVKKAEAPLSKEASDNVQRIYEEQGEAGAMDIIEAFKPITSKIVERRSEAPNFDRQLLTDEIETGQRGIFDLIREYKPESGVPLAAYINTYLPARAIEASRRVLGEEFTEDITEKVDVAAEEVATETKAKRKPRKIVLADRLGITDKVSKAINKIVPDLDIDKLTFKTLKNKIPNITGELFGIAPKKIESLANLTKKELQAAQMFINKNADLLINMLPEGATASGTATGVPNTLLKAFYTKTDRAKMAKTGTKAGLAIQQKNNINKTDFLETFGIIDGKPDRTDRNTSARVLALANLTGKMITNQAVRQNLGEADINVKKTIDQLKDGKSNVMFSKKAKKADKVKAIMKNVTNKKFKHGDISKEIGSKILAETVISRPSSKTGILKPAKVRDLFGKYNDLETGAQARDRVANDFIKQFPQHFDMLRTTMGGGITISMFQTTAEFELAVPNPGSKQNTVKRFSYHEKRRLNPNAIAKIKNKDFIKNEKAKLPLFKQFLLDVETYLKDKPQDVWFFEEMTKDTQNNMNSIVRIVAPFVAFPIKDGKPVYDKIAIEEHSFPQIVMGRSGISAAIAGEVESLWPVIQASYMQMSLLEVDDNKVTASGMKSNVPDVFYEKILPRIVNGELKNLPDGYVAFVRYAYAGVNLNNYKLLNGQTVAEFFGVDGIMDPETGLPDVKKQNDILIKQLTGEVASRYGENIAKVKFSKNVDGHNKLNKSIVKSRTMASKPAKGITVLDFDDTLATTKSLVKYTTPDGTTGTLNAEEFASTYEDLQDQGYIFDFSDFNKVVKGKLAPLFQKALKLQGKFGPENMFVLTARPPAAQKAIFDFLKANGLNIPLKNITGLGNSTSEAKALWIADKVGEGYNDFYFADDALQNVQAVKNMLDQFDVKSKVQQAKVKFSKGLDSGFNKILEEVTGIEAKKRFSDIKARKRGESKGKFRVFIPPSHEDFVGLLYNFMGKGRRGDQHRNFFEQALVRPLNRAYREIDAAKQAIANDYKSLNKQFPDVNEKLTKKTPDGDFTFQDAIRVYLWNKHGHSISGLSPTDQQNLVDIVMNDSSLQAYAETLNVISKQDTYVDPGPNWETGNIRIDLVDATGRVGRASYFTEFNENAEIIFSPENLNKIEAAYGKGVREALEDMLHRIKTGVNRPKGSSAKPNVFMNWLNASVSGVMFFNTRSSLLQQMSNVNYLNFADNNIYAAGKAFANQPQYWKDFAMIFNSDMLKQRRGGLQTDINGAELAEAIKKARPGNMFDQVAIITGKALRLGFLPTQIGDNIAIATGGAAFYRNRVNKYIKDGMSVKEAEAAAFTDFQDITQSTQQSARPDMTSQQQAMWIGKLILNFLNTPSQYNRIIKKAGSDIINRRITPPNTTQLQSDMSNMSRILYYGAAQNLIFYGLQTALFAVMFGLEDEDEEKKAEQILKKKERVIQGSIDTILRGSGIYGVAISTIKNMVRKFLEQREKGYNKDESAVLMEMLNFSPVVGIKARKIVNAEKTLNYNKKVIEEMETFDIDNPQWSAVTNYVEAITTAPANRIYQKTINLRNAADNDYTALQRALFFSGYTTWSLNLGDTQKMKDIKEKVKNKNKSKKKKKKSKTFKILK